MADFDGMTILQPKEWLAEETIAESFKSCHEGYG